MESLVAEWILIHQENWSNGIQTGKQLYYRPGRDHSKTIVYKSNLVEIISRDTTILKNKRVVFMTVNDSTGKLISQSRYSQFSIGWDTDHERSKRQFS